MCGCVLKGLPVRPGLKGLQLGRCAGKAVLLAAQSLAAAKKHGSGHWGGGSYCERDDDRGHLIRPMLDACGFGVLAGVFKPYPGVCKPLPGVC